MMKKWRRCLIFALTLAVFGVGTAFASESAGETRVFDMAELFSDSERAALEEQIGQLRNEMKLDAAIVTTEDNSGSARDFADDFYEEMELGVGNGHDGALFLIDMENGELWISTEGAMIRYLTDARIETILDDTFEYAADGEFFEAAVCFLEDLEISVSNGIAKDQYNYNEETGAVSRYHSIQWYEFLFAFVVAAAVAGITVLGVVREYNMKNSGTKLAANFNLSYRKDSSFHAGNFLAGVLLGSYVTKQVIASQNRGSSGGSRESSGRSLSSGGRSTTHHSSSGRTHGGGGKKFK